MYLCHAGAGAAAQIAEEGCFTLTDDHDRLWFCKELTETDPSQQPDYAAQFFRMGYLARKLGIAEGGKMFHGNADDEDDLCEKLNAVK